MPINIHDDEVDVIYTDERLLAVYPSDDLEPEGFVDQEQARLAGQPVPEDLVRRYFWWYRYLLLNRDYAECCRAKDPAKEHAAFYNDWGDIFAMPFPEWWAKHGRRVAGLNDVLVRDVTNDPDLPQLRSKPNLLILAVNIDAVSNKKRLYQVLNTLVRDRLTNPASPGRRMYRADQCDYDLLSWAYDAYIDQDDQRSYGHKPHAGKTASRIGLPTPRNIVDSLANRKVNDWKNVAGEIIHNALVMRRFPVHGRRKASRT